MLGASLQRRGGTARHDAVAWGYARAADSPWGSTSSRSARSTASASKTAASPGSRPARGTIKAKKVGIVRRRPFQRAGRHGRLPPADPPRCRCRPWSPSRSSRSSTLCRHVRRGARLRQPVGQGRAGDRRRHRPVHRLQPARLAARQRGDPGRDLRDVPAVLGACACCANGAASSTPARTPARSSPRPRSTGSTSTAAGAPAASRRRPARAGFRPHHRQGPAPQAQRPLHAGPLHDRLPDRRARRRPRCAH